MSLFKPPTPDYFDHYDRSRFMLVWNISLGILVVLICLILINIQTLSKTDLPNFIALGISICIIAFLKITHKYKVFSKIASISSVVLISNTFFFLTDDIHYNTSLWMLMNILFTFFTLGKIWGNDWQRGSRICNPRCLPARTTHPYFVPASCAALYPSRTRSHHAL